MNKIVLRDFNLGGISDSIFQGRANSVASMYNLDIHSDPGILKLNQKLKVEPTSIANIDSFIKVVLVCSDGYTYLFSSTNGKLWKRNNATGVYSFVTFLGANEIRDAHEWNGYIYFTTTNWIGRVVVGAPTDWSLVEQPFTIKSTVGTASFNGTTTVTGTSTTFNIGMIGGQIKNNADGTLFTISAVASPTSLTISSVPGTYSGAYTVYYPVPTATFLAKDPDFHPIIEINDKLYIGDGKYIAKLWIAPDSHIVEFVPNELTIDPILRVKSLGVIESDLLIGTYSNELNVLTRCYRWDRTGAYNLFDDVYENGINSFLKADNLVLASVGRKGNLYFHNGSELQNYKRIPGDWTTTKEAQIYQNASANLNGKLLFGLSNLSGDPATEGIYSLANYDRNYPTVLNLEYLPSFGAIDGTEIGALAVIGNEFLVTWKHGTTYGVDKLDLTLKCTDGYLTTMAMVMDRGNTKVLSGFVAYKTLPSNTSIAVDYKINHGSWHSVTLVNDTMRNLLYFKEHLPEANTIQVRFGLFSSTNATPEVESLEFSFL